jgi:hypothetical protein
MNVGYTKTKALNDPINNEVCPICGKDIYISKYWDDYACVDVNCPLGHGAKALIGKVNRIIQLMISIK